METADQEPRRPRVMALISRIDEGARAAQVARGSGADFVGALMIDAQLAASAFEEPVDAWLVSATDPSVAGPLGVILQTLNQRARATGVAVIARTSPELVDLAWARLPERSASVLCRSSIADEVAALTVELATVNDDWKVRDSRGERDVRQLRKLSEDVDRIARVLATLTAGEEEEENGTVRSAGDGDAAQTIPDDSAVRLIRTMVRARRHRDRFFPSDLFADPAWDMLLDLMAARIERKRVAVSSLCIAAAVPATTALRYLKTMTNAGLFVRRPDATDGRRVFMELSDAAADAMNRYLASFRDMIAPAIG